jgi:hypothetical protein
VSTEAEIGEHRTPENVEERVLAGNDTGAPHPRVRLGQEQQEVFAQGGGPELSHGVFLSIRDATQVLRPES